MRNLLALALLCAALVHTASSAQQRYAPPPQVSLPAPLVAVQAGEVPVRLESASVTVDAGAGVARTTLDMVFRNPGERVLEGNLRFPLRPGQQVVGFALDVDGSMREAVPVEKARGRQVFEAIERRGVDPGLLEQTEGDWFRLRVYPFPAGGSRRVRISLLEPLARDGRGESLTLPLQFAGTLDTVELAIRTRTRPRVEGLLLARQPVAHEEGAYRMVLARGSHRPARGITLRLDHARGPATQVQSHAGERYFLAEVPVPGAATPRTPPARIGLLWDSSMSGARRDRALELALLERYFRAAGNAEVHLLRLRDTAEAVERHAVVDGNWQALREALESTVYDGATSAGGWTPDPAIGEYLLFSDGLFNNGDAGFPAFAEAQRLYAVHAGSGGDGVRLAALAFARGGDAIGLQDSGDLEAAANALLQEPRRLQALGAIGATDLVAESPVVRDGVLRIAGRLTEATARLQLRVSREGRSETLDVPIGDAAQTALPALQWARFSLARLQADPERNRAAIASLGRRFGIVTPQTSLLVLENVEDYVRHDVDPPEALRAQFDRLKASGLREQAQGRQARLDRVAAAWAERVAWWEREFPKQGAPKTHLDAPLARRAEAREQRRALALPMAPPPPSAAAFAPGEPTSLDAVQVTGTRLSETASADAEAGRSAHTNTTIVLQPWRSDSAYARRLRQADPDRVYALYLDERARHAQATAFYLDVADILFEKQRPMLALRVLSNLAEMDLDNRHVLRVLAYRLMQAERADLAVPVLERVLAMGEEEPQSYRDLALAYAGIQRVQKAAELLYEVVQGEWEARFRDVAQIALAELNALIATSETPIDTDTFDPRLLRNLPLQLRTVLSWDSDNTDMDLWVTDPDGEKAYYGNRLTFQGGRMSEDFTGGYGPEEFALRAAKPGKYRVEANFYGDHQQLVTGATTLQLWLSTGFGTPRQQDSTVTLRLEDRSETVLVGEFEVR